MEDRLKVVMEEVTDVVAVWEDARRRIIAAAAEGGASVSRAEARLGRALRGMPLARWEVLTTAKVSLRTGRAARELNQVARSRTSVEEAKRALVTARTRRDSEMREAEASLAEVARRLARYGRLAERATGIELEGLRRLGRATGGSR
jgi:hypothetical protein